jgi:hypothetical protein
LESLSYGNSQHQALSQSNVGEIGLHTAWSVWLIFVAVTAVPHREFSKFSPQVGNLEILDTGSGSVTLQAQVNYTNPTPYSATLPYVNILLISNGTTIGHLSVKNILVTPGLNKNVLAQAVYDPSTFSGDDGLSAGRELISQYVSG